ncbi:hypothetical protein C1H46_023260 [Malus baccata]|uniref:Uncharacterized protein n=1 Tax=Malus baccata TaxID=106549 RepID=A0A540LXB5_MALBA|nr:hypothetical protein C1H46_023260 [Malus baccata]
MLGSLVDQFIGWALPLLSNGGAGDGTMELSLDSLREFLNVGDVGGIERYVLSILKACQVLLEDERTSLSLLHRLLGVLTLISLKFSRCFQPHFLDIVDLLLGWALVPDLAESDRRIIMDSFLQFQSHWVIGMFIYGRKEVWVVRMDWEFMEVFDSLGREERRGRRHGASLSLGEPRELTWRSLLDVLSCGSSGASDSVEVNLPWQNKRKGFFLCLFVFGH